MFPTQKDDYIFLTQEYRLKEFSVILQQQFAYHFNATRQTVCSIDMYILMPNILLTACNFRFRLLYIIIYDQTFSFNWLKKRWLHLLNLSAKDDCIFLTQEYRLKEFSVILQQQFADHFNATRQTVCSIDMYILMPNILLTACNFRFRLLYTWSDFQLQLIKQRWRHLLNLSAKDDCIFLTQDLEYRLKEFSVILQQQFTYYFNATRQTVCIIACIGMYILMPNILLTACNFRFRLLYIIINDQTFSFNWLSKDDHIFLTCQQKMTASFWHKSID